MKRIPCLHLSKYSRSGLLGAIKSIHLEEHDEKNTTTPKHSHDFFELFAVIQGDGCHIIGDTEVPFKRGQVFLIPPGIRHQFQNFQKIILQNFMFGRRALRLTAPMIRTMPDSARELLRTPPKASIAQLDATALTELDWLLNSIELENRRFTPGREMAILACFVQLLSRIFVQTETKTTGAMSIDSKIDSAVSYMQYNYEKKITLAELAAKAYMAQVTFIQHFRKEFHTTPMQWLLKLRLHHARRLLTSSDFPIGDIAQKCGFDDPFYFSRQFRKTMKCTPMQFRQHGLGHVQVFADNNLFSNEAFLEV